MSSFDYGIVQDYHILWVLFFNLKPFAQKRRKLTNNLFIRKPNSWVVFIHRLHSTLILPVAVKFFSCKKIVQNVLILFFCIPESICWGIIHKRFHERVACENVNTSMHAVKTYRHVLVLILNSDWGTFFAKKNDFMKECMNLQRKAML